MTEDVLKFFFRFTAPLPLFFFLGGCCCYDPSYSGDIAFDHSQLWQPECPVLFTTTAGRGCAVLPNPSEEIELPQLLDIALCNNPATSRSWSAAAAAAYNVGVLKSSLWPTIDFQEQATLEVNYSDNNTSFFAGGAIAADSGTDVVEQSSSTTTGDSSTFFRTLLSQLSISYLLLDWGERCANIEAAKQALLVADWTHNRTLQNVMSAVLQAYYDYQGAISLLKASYSSLLDAKKAYDAAEAQYTAGIVNKADMLLSKASYAEAQLREQENRGLKENAKSRLAHTLGLSEQCCFNVKELPQGAPDGKLQSSICSLIELAKKHRPDFAAAYAFYRERKAFLNAAAAAGRPTVSVDGQMAYLNIATPRSSNNYTGSATVTLDVPLFDGFFHRYSRRRAFADMESAWAELQAKESDIVLEVATSYNNYFTAENSYRFSEEFLTYSQEAYNVILEQYKQGISTIVELLKAQSDLAAARAQKVVSLTKWYVALVDIAYATGVLGTSDCHQDG